MSEENREIGDRAEELVLGESGETLAFATRADNRRLAAAMAKQAARSLEIFTPDLEPPVYDNEAFLEAVRHLALRSRSTRVRVLVQDAAHVMKHGHRLVELARSYTSAIQLHRPAPEHRDVAESFMIVDGAGFVHKPLSSRYEGTASFHDALEARKLLKAFDEMWERSQPDPELRRLHI